VATHSTEAVDEDVHIASVVLWIGDRAEEIQAALQKLLWVDCPLPSQQGKCVAVLEGATDAELISRIDYIRNLPGVIDTQLVYHVSESAQEQP
jgi:nitrate reductase NapD